MEYDKLDHLESIIEELGSNKRYTIVVFLLRAQVIEYGLKYLLGGYPFKPRLFKDEFLEKATLGQVIDKLESLKDDHLTEIINGAKKFNKLRREIVHHFLTSKKSIKETELDLREKLKVASDIEQGIHYFFSFLDGFR